MEQLSLKTRLYIASVIAAGLLALGYAFVNWRFDSPLIFGVLFVAGLFVSHWKVRLPSINGTMSVLCVLVFFAVSELSLSEAVVVVCAASLSQCLLFVKHKTRAVQVLFNVASMAVATAVTGLVYRAGLFETLHIAPGFRLLFAAGIFFLSNTLPVAVVISMTESRPFRQTWKDCYFWTLPFYLVGAGLAELTAIAGRQLGAQTCVLMVPAIYILYRSLNLYMGRVEDGRKHAEEISGLHLRTIEALALAIEAKDQTTANHLARVQIYAVELGRELKMSDLEIEALRAGALLHDIGKLAVPEHIISKPGKLTREEFEKMKIHPVVGAEILERVNFPYPVTPIVRSHHEKWNGEGYPDGLKGDAIPLGARILAAVDCLDALASDRQYRKALPLDDAMAIIASESGKSFDPQVVEVLQRRYQELEMRTHQSADDSQKLGLSVDIRVERGDAPAAGFEKAAPDAEPERKQANFITSIAAARQEMQKLFELTQELGSCLSLQDALSVIAARLKQLVPHDSLAVYLCKDDLLKPEFVAGENFRFFSTLEIPMGMGLSGWVAENHKPILNGNPAVESGHVEDGTRSTYMRSALSVPLQVSDRLVGVLTLYQTDKDAFSNEDLRILLSVSSKIGQTIDNNLLFQQAERSAATDYVTGLPNARSLFIHLDSEINRCERNGIPLCVAVGDLDGFKQINDHLGHLTGNHVLQKIADVFRQACRPCDYVARLGGDEFIIIMPDMQPEASQFQLDTLQATVMEIGADLGAGFQLSISFGLATCGVDGAESGQLLAKADDSMYEAKRQGKLQRTRTPFLLKQPA